MLTLGAGSSGRSRLSSLHAASVEFLNKGTFGQNLMRGGAKALGGSIMHNPAAPLLGGATYYETGNPWTALAVVPVDTTRTVFPPTVWYCAE